MLVFFNADHPGQHVVKTNYLTQKWYLSVIDNWISGSTSFSKSEQKKKKPVMYERHPRALLRLVNEES